MFRACAIYCAVYFSEDRMTKDHVIGQRKMKLSRIKFKQELQITLNVILVTSVFLLLTLPVCARMVVYSFVNIRA